MCYREGDKVMGEPEYRSWRDTPGQLRMGAEDDAEEAQGSCLSLVLVGAGVGLILAGGINPFFFVLGALCIVLALVVA